MNINFAFAAERSRVEQPARYGMKWIRSFWVLGERQPWKGTAADIFVQARFPLHSGRILVGPGRILISLMALVVAMLSGTGVVVWWKKSRARSLALARGARERRARAFVSGVRRDEDVVA